MSWAVKLCETYDNCLDKVGIADNNHRILLPIGYTTVSAHIECTLAHDGSIHAELIQKADAKTMIPSTIDSSCRSGKDANKVPHPLFDKLYFMAKNLAQYSDEKKLYDSHAIYMQQLQAWIQSAQGKPGTLLLETLYTYLDKGTLLHDLVEQGILIVDENGRLSKKRMIDTDSIDIFNLVTEQSNAVLRFIVEDEDEHFHKLWMEADLIKSFSEYYEPMIKQKGVCYISGKNTLLSIKHPAKIRYVTDQAKLISSNDKTNFTYLGLLTDSTQCVSIGYETSQKIHNALKWLIERQGKLYGSGELAIVAWGLKKVELINPLDNIFDFDDGNEIKIDIQEDYAYALNKALSGYYTKRFQDPDEDVVIMALDSAIKGKGRLSISYYSELKGSAFLQCIGKWYGSCAWQNAVNFEKNMNVKGKNQHIRYTGTPTIMDIIHCAYGNNVKEEIEKATTKELLSCIMDGRELPYALVEHICQRLYQPYTMTSEVYDANLHIGCAVLRKYLNDIASEKEAWIMGLDKQKMDISYLWGRLLAYVQEVEEEALEIMGIKDSETNAERYMRRFQLRPLDTWEQLYLNLHPYQVRLRKNKNNRFKVLNEEMNELINMLLNEEKYQLDGALDKCFILSYCAQLDELRYKRNKKEESEDK
ncbi:type I-C CRISPR-associated protein Cas8c/Csd1 [Longicatena caecimuris]|uniref:type I-C CRISPR-associated protein Cas8c/Csd1 n=1 Tax=Longicatena caecimuris TaxID=1796635 RepID=UPI0022E3A0A4|nr:type I-C CRISPR-associated protein Cas8c/Csd1 [Longicatena caecimuris]